MTVSVLILPNSVKIGVGSPPRQSMPVGIDFDQSAAQTDPCDWETKLEEWLLHQITPKVECALVCENTHLRSKVNELRREIDGQLDVHDKLRQEIAKLRAVNDELRSDNRCLQL